MSCAADGRAQNQGQNKVNPLPLKIWIRAASHCSGQPPTRAIRRAGQGGPPAAPSAIRKAVHPRALEYDASS
jgi:hypothetical protein